MMKAPVATRQDLVSAAWAVPVEVPEKPLAWVLRKAIAHYNRRNPDKPPATAESSPRFLQRICVNWLRHIGSNYDAHRNAIRSLSSPADRDAVGSIIKGRVLKQIAVNYPALAEEAARQALYEDQKPTGRRR